MRWLAALLALLTAAPAQAETVRIARLYGISYLPLIPTQDASLLKQERRARGLDLQTEWTTFTAVYERLAAKGAALGLQPDSVAKIEAVRQACLESLCAMRAAGLSMARGTDLLGGMHQHQAGGSTLRV